MRALSSGELTAVAGGQDPSLGTYQSSFGSSYGQFTVYANGFMVKTEGVEYINNGDGTATPSTTYGNMNNTSAADLAFFNALYDIQHNYSQALDSAEQQAASHGVFQIELYNSSQPPINKVANTAYVPVHQYSANQDYVNDGDILNALRYT